MPNYNQSYIYKLCCNDTTIEDFYIGSTTNLYNRKKCHKNNSINKNRRHYNIYVYEFIRENGGFDNWNMIMLKEINVDNKRQLEREERKVFEELKPTLNKRNPYRSKEENKGQDKEKHKITHKIWYEKNKEKVKKTNSERNKQKVECEVCHKTLNYGSLKRHLKNIHSV